MKRLQAGGMAVPALLRALVRPTLRKVSAASGNAAALRRRLAALPESERKEAMLSVVCEEVAVVLGAATLQSVSPVRSLKELGLDSLMAVELRNRLSARAEVQLPATLAFDYPTPARIAGLLSEKLQLDELPKLAWSSEDIRRKLSRISIESLARSGLLRDLMECPDEPQPSSVDVASEKMRELIGNISDEFVARSRGPHIENMNERRANELLRRSLLEVQKLSAALKKAEATSSEPIAIIAQACRTAGNVASPEDYWALLDRGRDAIGPFPARWDTEALYDPDPDEVGKTYAREGGFLQDVEQFDPAFFGISPREAVAMDPQQRLALEVVWEAIERAGLNIASLRETNTGVYLGSTGTDYGRELSSLDTLDGYRGTGQAGSVLSGRISYLFGFVGPAITVDTACSSSLTALHLACAGLRSGECDLAVAGGVQIMSTPAIFVEFSRLRVMARDGRCKPFSALADGAGWGEGCGVVVLKRLSDARLNGDPILAVVRGSAINQDGHSQGMTAPNGPSQASLIRKALARCGLTPDDIDAIEAHGTGTTLGDPIEAGALIEVFASPLREERPLWLGSCKSNIGHTQAASGVLGLIKMVLALEHESLTANFARRSSEPPYRLARQWHSVASRGADPGLPERSACVGRA